MTTEGCCIKCQSRNVDGLCRRCGSPLVYLESTAGWYPQEGGTERYWDGEQWTELVRAGSLLGGSMSQSESPQLDPKVFAPDGTPWSTPEGWYPDPENSAHIRYWDGSRWTQVALKGKPQRGVSKALRGAASWAIWLGVPALIAVGLWFIQNRGTELPDALNGVPGLTTPAAPESCDDVEAAAIKVSEEQVGVNSPFRVVRIELSKPTTIADEENLALGQWALSGGLVYPTLKCDAVAVLANGTKAPVFVAIGSSATDANAKIVGLADRFWGDMTGLPFPWGTAIPSPAMGS